MEACHSTPTELAAEQYQTVPMFSSSDWIIWTTTDKLFASTVIRLPRCAGTFDLGTLPSVKTRNNELTQAVFHILLQIYPCNLPFSRRQGIEFLFQGFYSNARNVKHIRHPKLHPQGEIKCLLNRSRMQEIFMALACI